MTDRTVSELVVKIRVDANKAKEDAKKALDDIREEKIKAEKADDQRSANRKKRKEEAKAAAKEAKDRIKAVKEYQKVHSKAKKMGISADRMEKRAASWHVSTIQNKTKLLREQVDAQKKASAAAAQARKIEQASVIKSGGKEGKGSKTGKVDVEIDKPVKVTVKNVPNVKINIDEIVQATVSNVPEVKVFFKDAVRATAESLKKIKVDVAFKDAINVIADQTSKVRVDFGETPVRVTPVVNDELKVKIKDTPAISLDPYLKKKTLNVELKETPIPKLKPILADTIKVKLIDTPAIELKPKKITDPLNVKLKDIPAIPVDPIIKGRGLNVELKETPIPKLKPILADTLKVKLLDPVELKPKITDPLNVKLKDSPAISVEPFLKKKTLNVELKDTPVAKIKPNILNESLRVKLIDTPDPVLIKPRVMEALNVRFKLRPYTVVEPEVKGKLNVKFDDEPKKVDFTIDGDVKVSQKNKKTLKPKFKVIGFIKVRQRSNQSVVAELKMKGKVKIESIDDKLKVKLSIKEPVRVRQNKARKHIPKVKVKFIGPVWVRADGSPVPPSRGRGGHNGPRPSDALRGASGIRDALLDSIPSAMGGGPLGMASSAVVISGLVSSIITLTAAVQVATITFEKYIPFAKARNSMQLQMSEVLMSKQQKESGEGTTEEQKREIEHRTNAIYAESGKYGMSAETAMGSFSELYTILGSEEVGASSKNVQDIVVGLGSVASSLGVDQEAVDLSFTGLSQFLVAPDADNIKQVYENVRAFRPILAEAMNMTTVEMTEATESGTLLENISLKEFSDNLAKIAISQGERQFNASRGQLQTEAGLMTEAFNRGFVEIGGAAEPGQAGLMEDVRDLLVSDDAKELFINIGTIFSTFAEGVSESLGIFGPTVEKFMEYMDRLANTTEGQESIKEFAATVVKVIDFILSFLMEATAITFKIADAIGNVVGALWDLLEPIREILDYITPDMEDVKKVGGLVGDAVEWAFPSSSKWVKERLGVTENDVTGDRSKLETNYSESLKRFYRYNAAEQEGWATEKAEELGITVKQLYKDIDYDPKTKEKAIPQEEPKESDVPITTGYPDDVPIETGHPADTETAAVIPPQYIPSSYMTGMLGGAASALNMGGYGGSNYTNHTASNVDNRSSEVHIASLNLNTPSATQFVEDITKYGDNSVLNSRYTSGVGV